MNKLIKVAEELYKKIDKAQVHLVNARLNNDEEGKKSAISEMETAMCNAMQLLKCFIERKDNIVDLGEVWHDGNVVPEEGKQIFVVTKSGFCYAGFYRHFNGLLVNGCLLLGVDIAKYIYVEDLLPKGGE